MEHEDTSGFVQLFTSLYFLPMFTLAQSNPVATAVAIALILATLGLLTICLLWFGRRLKEHCCCCYRRSKEEEHGRRWTHRQFWSRSLNRYKSTHEICIESEAKAAEAKRRANLIERGDDDVSLTFLVDIATSTATTTTNDNNNLETRGKQKDDSIYHLITL